ncbi:tetratricopeptide repeat protein [Porticoccus sp.]|uniref:tetratricopeptide repeat protein n=1 Tax=Porticoccus sp. TaxID=2024853 RepID=UPI003F69912A
MKHTIKNIVASSVALLALTASSGWAGVTEEISTLQKRWAEVNYQMEGETQSEAFASLATETDAVVSRYPDNAAPLIWRGIIKSTYAGAKGGLGALSLAKSSKADLEAALAIDPQALDGSAYTSLGTLYCHVPGWPIGFGDDKKAEKLLLKALAINPDGIDSNYFYADYLIGKKRYQDARTYLLKAKKAAPRINRPLADAGRQKEISQALAVIEQKLGS